MCVKYSKKSYISYDRPKLSYREQKDQGSSNVTSTPIAICNKDTQKPCSTFTSIHNTICVDDLNECPITDIKIVPSAVARPVVDPN